MNSNWFRGVLVQEGCLGDLVTWGSVVACHLISWLERYLLKLGVHVGEVPAVVDRDRGFGMKMFVQGDHVLVCFKDDPSFDNLMEREGVSLLDSIHDGVTAETSARTYMDNVQEWLWGSCLNWCG